MSRPRGLLADRFSQDVLWNIVSLGVAGACGVVVNYLVGVVYGASALGVFNQVFAIYLVFSQLAALGVQSSVLTHIAATSDRSERRAIATSALLVIAAQAVVMGSLMLALARPIADVLDSPDVAIGIAYATPGLVAFALNKVVLACLNGTQRMRWYAVFQAGRIVLMAVGFGGCILADAPARTLPVILSIGEVITLVAATATISPLLGRTARSELSRWARAHLRFGVRGFLSGLFSDLNTRIDVLVLGAFASDRLVGAYSMASLLAEGVYQVLIALRSNYAPIVVRLLVTRDEAELQRVVRKGRRNTYLGASLLGAIAIAGYAIVIPVSTSDPEIAHSWVYFAILVAGMVASAGYVPFNQMLLWGSRPGWHTIMVGLTVATAALTSLAGVALAGAVGAAVATAATYAFTVVLLKLLVGRVLQLRI
jgi:O-antigen/teichoic acid export membrane protein